MRRWIKGLFGLSHPDSKWLHECPDLSGGYKTWSVATAKIKNERPAHLVRPKLFLIRHLVKVSSCKSTPAATAIKVDACGLMCPGPIMQLKKNYENLREDESLEITATDQASEKMSLHGAR